MSNLTIYITSVSSSLEIKRKQSRISMVLEGKKIAFAWKDISTSQELKDEMRRIAGNPTALPPQITNGNEFCGDFDAFESAVEDEILEKFLKIE